MSVVKHLLPNVHGWPPCPSLPFLCCSRCDGWQSRVLSRAPVPCVVSAVCGSSFDAFVGVFAVLYAAWLYIPRVWAPTLHAHLPSRYAAGRACVWVVCASLL